VALLQGPVRLVGERAAAHQALLIDPQTCGPLLAAIPAEAAATCLEQLALQGFGQACLLGHVVSPAAGLEE
jgi:selenide,water dikinase